MEIPEETMQQVYEQAIGSMSIEIARGAAIAETLRADLVEAIARVQELESDLEMEKSDG